MINIVIILKEMGAYFLQQEVIEEEQDEDYVE